MMPRVGNFPKSVKREAWARSQMKCEAVGLIYGLEEGQRCNVSLLHGVEYDHFDLVANSGDNSLENCRAVCPKCHAFKTAKHDTPKAAKTQRQQDKARNIVRQKAKIQSPGFPKAEKERKPPMSVGMSEIQRRFQRG